MILKVGNNKNNIKASQGEKIFDTLNIIGLVLFCFITIYPFWYVLVYAFNEGQDAMLGGLWFWPREFTLENFAYVLSNQQMKIAYLNTIIRTITGAALATIVTSLAAYAMTKKDLPGRGLILAFFILPMFIGGTVVTRYVVIAKLGFLNKFAVYIIPVAFSFFFMVVLRTFIYGIPISLEESAKIDGAGYTRIFFNIILPLCKPAIATIILFSGVEHWLDFYTNLLYVSKKTLMTAQYLLYMVVRSNQMQVLSEHEKLLSRGAEAMRPSQVTPESIKMATLMVVTLPIVFVYPFLQKYFIRGITLGALKE